MRDHHARLHRAWVVVEPIGKGRRVPVAERVKVWRIGAEEPVVPAARLLEKPITHLMFDRSTRRGLTRRDLTQQAPQGAPAAASSTSLGSCRGA
jgi:hypothetical protein